MDGLIVCHIEKLAVTFRCDALLAVITILVVRNLCYVVSCSTNANVSKQHRRPDEQNRTLDLYSLRREAASSLIAAKVQNV